jgi:GWxTD domain-containing protein
MIMRLRPILRRAALGILLLSFGEMTLPCYSQVEVRPKKPPDVPDFYVDAISFFADTLGSRLDVYIQVPYEDLRFLKVEGGFDAKYEVTFSVFTPENTLVVEKNWIQDVMVQTFEESVAPEAYSMAVRSIYVKPGKYNLRTQLREFESNKVSQFTRTLEVPDFARQSLALSDIMIVSKLRVENGKKSITPNVSRTIVGPRDAFHLFFEVYNQTPLESLEISYSVVTPKQVRVYSHSLLEPISRGRTQVFLPIDTLELPIGDYKFLVEARDPTIVGDTSVVARPFLASVEKAFSSRRAGIPRTVDDLDLAIEQMRYIAKGNELDSLKKAQTLEEKQQRFLEFWRKRDPTPGTVRNEGMEEYFNRVDYANRHFGHHVEGWKTDMGMVYIILGAPNTVDRHPFEMNTKPYEVWYYYERNRRFVFLDETGFGDYRLITPLDELWDRY